jgi:hypothetical protein
MEARLPHLDDLVPTSDLAPRSRKSSISSVLTDLSQMELDDQPKAGVQSAGDSGGRMVGIESNSDHAEDNAENDDHDSDAEMEGDGVQSAGKAGGPMVGVESESDNGEQHAEDEEEEDSDAVEEDGDEAIMKPVMAKQSHDMKKASQPSADLALADQLASFGLRRSARNKPSPQVVSESPQVVPPVPLPKVVVMRRSVAQKDSLVNLVRFGTPSSCKI